MTTMNNSKADVLTNKYSRAQMVDDLTLPVLTTAERDALDAQIGQFIFNTTTDEFQGRTNGGSWVVFTVT